MSDQLPVTAASNTFERIKRVNDAGADFWSARELARVLEYTNFRNFTAVIAKAREACVNSGHAVADHFVEINEMVSIGSGAQREVEDWPLDSVSTPWEAPIMNATMIDDRRRLVMPPELPAHSPVTVQQIDEDTWLVKRARKAKTRMVMLLPDVKKLSRDAAWQETESRIVARNNKKVAPFEE